MSNSTALTVRLNVWISCLSYYNSGALVGQFFHAEDAGEVARGDLHDNLTSHEELWCFDHEGFPSGIGEMDPTPLDCGVSSSRRWESRSRSRCSRGSKMAATLRTLTVCLIPLVRGALPWMLAELPRLHSRGDRASPAGLA